MPHSIGGEVTGNIRRGQNVFGDHRIVIVGTDGVNGRECSTISRIGAASFTILVDYTRVPNEKTYETPDPFRFIGRSARDRVKKCRIKYRPD